MNKHSKIAVLLLLSFSAQSHDLLSDTAANFELSVQSKDDDNINVAPGLSLSKYFHGDSIEVQGGINRELYLKGNYYYDLTDSQYSVVYSLGIESVEGNLSPTVGFGFGIPINTQYSFLFMSSINSINDVSFGLQMKRKFNFKSNKPHYINKEHLSSTLNHKNINKEHLSSTLNHKNINIDNTKENTCSRFYTVNQGEYFWMLARRFNINANDLIRLNPQVEKPDVLYPGDRLCIKRALLLNSAYERTLAKSYTF
ncbi:LysM peptidoglycan-binding domain-containing protein [Vibrio parahaemolyticus]|uniref:LysM peptidoglycan-binding domain-containing protein n=1 Tax=Vibrio parahaemolyticus TaxID=670 RepID=UPI003891F15E